jgi:hypothetical protein
MKKKLLKMKISNKIKKLIIIKKMIHQILINNNKIN